MRGPGKKNVPKGCSLSQKAWGDLSSEQRRLYYVKAKLLPKVKSRPGPPTLAQKYAVGAFAGGTQPISDMIATKDAAAEPKQVILLVSFS